MEDLPEAKKIALRSLTYARSKLKLAGFTTNLIETINMDKGGMTITLQLENLTIREAGYLANQAFGIGENAT